MTAFSIQEDSGHGPTRPSLRAEGKPDSSQPECHNPVEKVLIRRSGGRGIAVGECPIRAVAGRHRVRRGVPTAHGERMPRWVVTRSAPERARNAVGRRKAEEDMLDTITACDARVPVGLPLFNGSGSER